MNENVTTKVRIGEVRFSYCHIFTPEAVADEGEKKYSLSVIIPKSNKKLIAEIKAAIEAAVQAGISQRFEGKRPANMRSPLRDGDVDRPEDDAYANSYFINASSKTKPGIVKIMKLDGKNKLVEVTNEEDVYSGCYGFVSVNFFAYNNRGNKGIGAGLNNILKTRDGDYLGGRASAESDFEAIDLDEFNNADDFDMPE